MIARRGFLAALGLGALAKVGSAQTGRPGFYDDLPLMQAGSGMDALVLTIHPAGQARGTRGPWRREHGRIHRLATGDPYPEAFGQGWVAWKQSWPTEPDRWGIRWHDGKVRHAHLHWPPGTDCGGDCVGRRPAFYPLALGEALWAANHEGEERRLSFDTQQAVRALTLMRNERGWAVGGVRFVRLP